MSTIKTFDITWELPSLKNAGGNMILRVDNAITLVGMQIDVSMGFMSNSPGFSEVLAIVMWLPQAVWAQGWEAAGPNPQGYMVMNNCPDVSFNGLASASQVAVGSGGGNANKFV